MKLGAMNNPERNVIKEINLFGEMRFDFVELAVEGPKADPETLKENLNEIKEQLTRYEMFAIAHIPWFFDIGNPYKTVQKAYLKEAKKVIKIASKFEIEKVGIHILKPKGLFEDKLGRNIAGIKEIVEEASDRGITLCVENMDISTFNVEDFSRIFSEVPNAKFLFDIGHANLGLREEEELFVFLKNFYERLAHVHVHDNLGYEDLHLPLGTGNIDWKKMVRELKRVYDGTITLEIHAHDRDYLRISREKFLALWKGRAFNLAI